MKTDPPDYVEFTADDLGAVLVPMSALGEDGNGWINFEPAINVDDLPPPRTGLAALLSGRGPDVPLATWTPGTAKGGRPEPPTIGIQHGAGPGARARLEETGRGVPKGWVVLQDHSKRGLVVAVSPSVGHDEIVAWLLAAAKVLSTVPLDREWRAAVYRT
ncbi:MAG: hypothetical protein ABR540_13610 [Acidimicrobiales bacterium]|nr:hypothetical protein [Actinomycetota bacterium]